MTDLVDYAHSYCLCTFGVGLAEAILVAKKVSVGGEAVEGSVVSGGSADEGDVERLGDVGGGGGDSKDKG